MRDYSITDSTFPNLSEIEQALDYNPESEALSKTINITNNKRLNQILQAIQLILQNVRPHEVKADLDLENTQIEFLAKDLGLEAHIHDLVNELRDVYKGWV